jgi:ATP-binding cassette subfamily B protein
VESDRAERPNVSLRRVVGLFTPYRLRLGVVLGLVVAASVISLASPFLLRAILDVALPRGRTGLLSLLALGMLGVAVVNGVIQVLQSYLSLTVGQRVMDDLRRAVYAHLQRMSLAFFTRTHTGDVQSRIANDIGGMSQTVTSVATSVVGAVTTVIGSLAAMVALDWRLTIVSLVTLPGFVWISRHVGSERRRISMERQKQFAVIANLVQESLSVNGFLLGRVMGRSESRNAEFAEQSLLLTDVTVRSNMAGRWRQSVIQIVMTAMPVLIYWAAGVTSSGGHLAISIGTLVAFTSLQQGLFGPSQQLMQVGIAVQSSLSLFERVFEYLDLPADITEPARPVPLPAAGGHVRFEGVEFSYGEEPVLRGVDIDLPPGGHLAVVGATGAGKTTLGYLVPRLYDVTAGRVTIDGVDVRELSFADLAATVGVVSQDPHLMHTTVAENLRFAKPDAADDELVAVAKAAQIHDLLASLPDGYETVVGERGYRFSGGEKQRLAIARTMLRNPPVLVLDEATSSLDTDTERAVQQALDTLSDGRTTITIAHRLSTIRDADQIIVLDHGRVVERGTHATLTATGGVYARLIAVVSRRTATEISETPGAA